MKIGIYNLDNTTAEDVLKTYGSDHASAVRSLKDTIAYYESQPHILRYKDEVTVCRYYIQLINRAAGL